MPTSSFLYRKVIPAVAAQGLHAVAFDFPGLGLAERPEDFDYSWSGLAGWTGEAIDALEIDRCHLVVHDIGGPIGFEWAIRNPDRVLSVTVAEHVPRRRDVHAAVADAPIRDPGHRRSCGSRRSSRRSAAQLFYLEGIENRSATPRHEVQAHIHLLKHRDRGRAFLRIMRGFELTAEKQRFLWDGLAERAVARPHGLG